jgi:hypothetical protein
MMFTIVQNVAFLDNKFYLSLLQFNAKKGIYFYLIPFEIHFLTFAYFFTYIAERFYRGDYIVVLTSFEAEG